MDFVIFVIAIATLIWSADILIQEGEKIALQFNISEFIIGATLIALGTTLPEMATTTIASLNNRPEIAVGNIIGSNILNITMILGTILIFMKKDIDIQRDFFSKNSYWVLSSISMFILIIFDGTISRFDAILLLIFIGAYILFLRKEAKGIIETQINDIDRGQFRWLYSIPLITISLIFLIVGANFTVESASNIAKSFGVSEWVIGIIMISLGASLPELVVSITASIKGKVDMAIGNIIGSNIANITIVLGFAGLANPIDIDIYSHLFDILTMLIVSSLLLLLTTKRLYSIPTGITLYIILSIFLEHTFERI